MATKLGETTAAVADQLGAKALAWTTGDWAVLVPTLIWATGAGAPSARVAAYVPALARTAVTTAMAPSSTIRRGLADRTGVTPGWAKDTGPGPAATWGTTGVNAGYWGCIRGCSYPSGSWCWGPSSGGWVDGFRSCSVMALSLSR